MDILYPQPSVFLVLQENYEYNDEYYWFTDGCFVHESEPSFPTRTAAEAERDRRNAAFKKGEDPTDWIRAEEYDSDAELEQLWAEFCPFTIVEVRLPTAHA